MIGAKLLKNEPAKNTVGYAKSVKESTKTLLDNVVFNGLYFRAARKIQDSDKLGKWESEKAVPILVNAGYVRKNAGSLKLTKLGESYIKQADFEQK